MFKKEFIKYLKEGNYRVIGFILRKFEDSLLISDGTGEIKVYGIPKEIRSNFVEVFGNVRKGKNLYIKCIKLQELSPEQFFYKLLDYLYYEEPKKRVLRIIKEIKEIGFKELKERSLLDGEKLQEILKELLSSSVIYEPEPLKYKIVEEDEKEN